ncbi:hypothetical protein LXL04_020605 [Taraxacum kok-saghyz]
MFMYADIISEVYKIYSKLNVITNLLYLSCYMYTPQTNYAKQMMDYINVNPEQTTLSIILQRPYVNNSFGASKLFINDKIDDILSFKRSLIEKSGDQSSSSHQTISSSIVYSFQNEFLSKNNFYKILAIHGLDEFSYCCWYNQSHLTRTTLVLPSMLKLSEEGSSVSGDEGSRAIEWTLGILNCECAIQHLKEVKPDYGFGFGVHNYETQNQGRHLENIN